MPKVTFVISEPGVRNSIVFFYTCHDGRLKYYTGQQAPNLDDLDKGTASVLDRIRRHVDEMEIDHKVTNEPITKGVLKASLDRLLNKRVKIVSGDMFSRMTALVDAMESGVVVTPGKKRYSAGSIKTFRFTIDMLRRFAPALSLASTDRACYFRFISWMQGKGYSMNYIGSQVKNWKTLGKGIGGAVFDEPWFKKMQEDATDIYLTEEEILAISRVPLSGFQQHIKDWFVIGCYTGLRVSDLLKLEKKNIIGESISIANQKTGEKVIIPLHPIVKQIIDRYRGFPPAVSDVLINEWIKKIGKSAGINDKVLFTITKGGVREDKYLRKSQAITTHTARRSFITNMLKNGVPDSIVMKLTGIRSAATLKRYNKLGPDEAAQIAAGHPFFK